MNKRISLIFVFTIILKPIATYFIFPVCLKIRMGRTLYECYNVFSEHIIKVFYHFEFYIVISAIITYFFWYFNYINFEEFSKIKINNHKINLNNIKSVIYKQNKLIIAIIILFFVIAIYFIFPLLLGYLLVFVPPYSFYWLRKNKNIKLSSDTVLLLVILGIISLFFYEATSRGIAGIDGWYDILKYPLVFLLLPSYVYFLSGIFCYLFNRNKVTTKLIDKHARIWILFFSCVMIYGFFNAIK